MPRRSSEENDDGSTQARWLRLDLLIAVCALLISSFASAASWWQARLLAEQTHVLQEQLGAQVWPYVGISETLDDSKVQIAVENDGLGPAVLRSASVIVDGKPEPSLIAMLHQILGPNLLARKPPGEKLSLDMNSEQPGAVLRPGESQSIFALTSRHFAAPFARGYGRITFRVCYCAIVPGKCWLSDSSSTQDPQPLAGCREIPSDLLHSSPIDVLTGKSRF